MNGWVILWTLISAIYSVFPLRKCVSDPPSFTFYKVKTCYRSSLPIISAKNLDTVGECQQYAHEKNGLAFNFGPLEFRNLSTRWYRNCQVVGCPEITNSSTLVFDPLFDYYSAFGNLNLTTTSICIKSIGVFELIPQKLNYYSAVTYCQNQNAHLAEILSEARTNLLSNLLKSLNGWYKAAFVGLDDMEVEGSFQTPKANFLECIKYRAWAVGQPRTEHKHEDCVILDAERTWRAINCKIKLPFICEFYPGAPPQFRARNCTKIKDSGKKRQCLADKQLSELYKKSKRIDQCALINDLY